jgi:DNA-binding transcriptional ArsR family regulator
MLDDATYVDLAEIFRALGDATRAKMVFSLLQQDLCTCDLAELTGISESAVSQHLRVLRSLRLVKSRRAGKQVFHSLDDAHIAILLHVGLSHVRDGDADHPTMEQLLTHLVPLEGGHR